MNHVSTVCTHCADGCKVTLGVRQANDGSEIVRADNRDKSGINNDFLCAKGRFGFDFVESPERLTKPLVRNAAGQARTGDLGARAARCGRQAEGDSRQQAAARPSASSARTAPPTKRTTCCRSSRALFFRPTTSTTSARRITQRLRAPSPDTRAKPPACAISPRRRQSCSSAAIRRTSIRCWRGTCAPTCASIARGFTLQIRSRSSSSARPRRRCSASGRWLHRIWPRYLDATRHQIRQAACWPRNRWSSSLAQEFRGADVDALVDMGPEARQCALRLSRRSRQLARRGRHGALP